MKAPAFQFYVKQWLGDDNVMLMSWVARGMHMHFMCIAWQQDPACSLPDDDELLRAWAANAPDWEHIKDRWPEIKRQVLRAWTLKNNRWTQAGLLQEYEKQQQNRRVKAKAADIRWGNQDKVEAGAVDDACAMHMQCPTAASASSTTVSTAAAGQVIQHYHPGTDQKLTERIRAAAAAARPTISDEELADALVKTHKGRQQRSAALWLSTIPAYLSGNPRAKVVPSTGSPPKCKLCMDTGRVVHPDILAGRDLNTVPMDEWEKPCPDCGNKRKMPGRAEVAA